MMQAVDREFLWLSELVAAFFLIFILFILLYFSIEV